ncbi:MAG: DUF2339 domain-containing protein [Planctomycetota bacterium]|nr:DUF2339 domain-containing protein [Planctomycetota bacterium]
MGEDELRRELERLLQRVERIEQLLELTGPPEGEAPTPPRAELSLRADAERAETAAGPEAAKPTERPTRPQEGTVQPPPVIGQPVAPPTRRAAPPPPPAAAPVPAAARSGAARPPDLTRPERKAEPEGRGLEFFVGAKLAAWVAVPLILIAAALLIKLGIDSGWWGRMSETLRCLLIAGFGLALVAGGEIALRRISRVASVSLFAAGLGVLYLDAFATFSYFSLLSREGAFALMAVVALVGFGLTLRARFATIGVLSLIGGYLTPVLLYSSTGRHLELLCFMTVLFVIALALSAAAPRPFRLLRYVVLACHLPLALAWMIWSGQQFWVMAIVFMSLWWAMLLAETVYAALRRQSRLGNPVALLIMTAWYVTAGCWVLVASAPGGPDWLGLFTAGIGVLGAAAALQFGPGLDGLRQKPREAMDVLAVALWAQFGVLIAVAVALQFDGYGQSLSWLAVAVASIEIGRRLPSRGCDVFGLAIGALALLRVALLDPHMTALQNELAVVGGITINGWAILALPAIAAAHVAAHRLRESANAFWIGMPVVAAAIGTLLWMGMCYDRCDDLWVTGGWLLGAAALLGCQRFGKRQRYLALSLFLLAATAAKWLIIDAAGERMSAQWGELGVIPFANWHGALALAIVVIAWWASRVLRRHIAEAASTGAQIILACGSIFLLIALSFELDRALTSASATSTALAAYSPALLRGLAFAALWGVGALIMMQLSRGRDLPIVLGAGWVLLVLSALLWLGYGTLYWRIMEGTVDTTVVVNLQFAIGALLAILLYAAARLWRSQPADQPAALARPADDIAIAMALLALIGLWLGTLEIDRFFHDRMATHAGLSVYWALYGVFLVVAGFAKRAAAARYAGLALLAVTVLKVLFIDLATVEQLWRVISFLASGLLLVGTSLLYTKLSPRILASVGGAESTAENTESTEGT